MEHQATYSKIIDPATYNALIAVHLYIAAADKAICQIVAHDCGGKSKEVLEIGCGPARILPLLADAQYEPFIHLTGIDHDETFVEYAKEVMKRTGTVTRVLLADATTYQHIRPIDIAVSQGFHHHVPKGEQTRLYLENIYRQLKPGGIYVVGDEFLPHYDTSEERLRRAVVWYSHIISHALYGKYEQLAVEEAKTLLDDLAEGTQEGVAKSDAQIKYVLDNIKNIDHDDKLPHYRKVNEQQVEDFLAGVASLRSQQPQGTPSMDLSRGDFKVCHRVFCKEVETVGFEVIGVKTVGPIETIGAMAVYTLLKPQ